ncbi:F-box domain-containing protein [Mycena sanguinolenta]|uniref:F-box domain-containing protein n=1 Tax=Mycena sanguinolenta TaxID=230812 RepID=A0A8H6XLD6_9AGAR|nr:F-box domain-containing protein [Mycena sanguinolenta]
MPALCSACSAQIISTTDNFELSLAPTDPQTLARFEQLSTTNEPPQASELAFIRPIIDKASARLASLDEEISRLQSRLQKLEDARAALSEYHAKTTVILSPMRRIPPEIIGEIFSCTLPTIRDALSVENCPWVLTHVCGGWRDVALSIPSLWSLIKIDFSLGQRYPPEMIRTQIQRAGSLKIHFFGAWVQWGNAESQPPELEFIDFLQMADSLVDIGVSSIFRFIPTRLPASHQLIRYDFDAPWETHYELLKSLPNLQEVHLIRSFDFDGHETWPESREPISLIHLRRLYVNELGCLDSIRAPILEGIAIAASNEIPAETRLCLERFLGRSGSSPRQLHIQGLLDAQTMAAILQKHPSFTEIAVTADTERDKPTERKILSEFLTLFTLSHSTPFAMTFPLITRISYACGYAESTLYPSFLDMLDSRRNLGHGSFNAAEIVFLNSCPATDPQSMERIAMLRDDGFQFSLLAGYAARDRNDGWLFRTTWA